MDTIAPMATGRLRTLVAPLLVPICFGLVLVSGCVSLPTMPSILPDDPVCNMVCWWDRSVKVAYDTEHDGAPFVGMAGQVHFFGKDQGHPIAVRGKVVAEWFDITGTLASNPRPLTPCIFPAEVLHALQGKSPLGPAYTLFLDWPDYRPDVKQLLIKVRFYPANGHGSVSAPPAIVSLYGDSPVTASHSSVPVVVAPGFGLPPATTPGGTQLTGTPSTVSYGPPPPIVMPAINGH